MKPIPPSNTVPSTPSTHSETAPINPKKRIVGSYPGSAARRTRAPHANIADMRDYVFGYGSLVTGVPAAFATELRGMRRGWGVAMDNRVDIPGYKCYLDAQGYRPAVSVCFLDVEADPSTTARVNGVCMEVGDAELTALDRRERNYDRVDVTDRCTADLGGARVWTYRGSLDGRARFDAAARAGTAVIHAGYLESVRAGFRALGETEWTKAAASLQSDELPVLELVRRELS